MPSLNIFQYTYYPWREQCPEASHLSLKLPCKLILQLGVHQHFLYWYRKILTRKNLNFPLCFWSVQKTTFLKFALSFDKSYFFFFLIESTKQNCNKAKYSLVTIENWLKIIIWKNSMEKYFFKIAILHLASFIMQYWKIINTVCPNKHGKLMTAFRSSLCY